MRFPGDCEPSVEDVEPIEVSRMNSSNWYMFAFGVACVVAGLFCFFSRRLQDWGMQFTTQGVLWGKLVGVKRAPYVVKYFSSAGFFIYAAFIFYDAIYGR